MKIDEGIWFGLQLLEQRYLRTHSIDVGNSGVRMEYLTEPRHAEAVAHISARIRELRQAGTPFRIHHGATNSTRTDLSAVRDPSSTVSTASLSHILSISSATLTAVVEPNVPMDALVAATLGNGRNLVPRVVMEFPGITCGGSFAGLAGESSSFREGFFEQTVGWVEAVLADGSVVTARRTGGDADETDLFWSLAASLGTVGVVTALEVSLRPALSGVVELKYLRCGGWQEAVTLFEELSQDETTDFLDGIAFTANHIVVCAGRLVPKDDPCLHTTVKRQRFDRARDPWYYLHVRSRTSSTTSSSAPSATPPTDLVSIASYLFRFDRGAFWMGQHAFEYFAPLCVSYNRVTRALVDPLMRTRRLYHALHVSGVSRIYVIQDILVPVLRAVELLEWVETQIGVWPLWLCPIRQRRDMERVDGGSDGTTATGLSRPIGGLYAPLASPTKTPATVLNVGIWGIPSRDLPLGRDWRLRHVCSGPFLRLNRALEDKAAQLGARKWPYAQMYYPSEDAFWAAQGGVSDREAYEAGRRRWGAVGLSGGAGEESSEEMKFMPSVWDKVCMRGSVEDEEARRREEWARKPIVRRLGLAAAWDRWPTRGLYGAWKTFRGGEYLLASSANSWRKDEKTVTVGDAKEGVAQASS